MQIVINNLIRDVQDQTNAAYVIKQVIGLATVHRNNEADRITDNKHRTIINNRTIFNHSTIINTQPTNYGRIVSPEQQSSAFAMKAINNNQQQLQQQNQPKVNQNPSNAQTNQIKPTK